MAEHARQTLESRGVDVAWLDLKELEMPLCDGGAAYAHPNAATAKGLVEAADAVLLATPVYNFDANAAAKNLIELTGRAWTGKVVGFLCAAGGQASYMSIMSLANSLMLDFRCFIVPRFVYALGDAFEGGDDIAEEIAARIDELAAETVRVAGALAT